MNRRHFLALVAWAPWAACPAAPGDLAEDAVEVSYEDGLYSARFAFVVAAPMALAWEVLTDFEHMAAFVPNLEQSEVLIREPGGLRVRQRGRLDFGPFAMRFESQRQVELRPREGIIRSRAIGGSTRHMQSEMRLLAVPDGTRLDYSLEMIPDRWIPSSLGLNFLRHELAEQFTAIAGEMLRRRQSRRSS